MGISAGIRQRVLASCLLKDRLRLARSSELVGSSWIVFGVRYNPRQTGLQQDPPTIPILHTGMAFDTLFGQVSTISGAEIGAETLQGAATNSCMQDRDHI